MARKKKHEEHENHERWLVSYADFITLLFAFFVVMYSISSVNEGKYRVLSSSMISAFSQPTQTLSPIRYGEDMKSPVLQNKVLQEHQNKMERIGVDYEVVPTMQEVAKMDMISDEVEKKLKPLVDQEVISIHKTNKGVEIEIKSNILFSSGQAVLQKSAKPALGEIADVIRKLENPVNVEGFTDNIPIRTLVFPSNWELSAARAANVVHLFSQLGIDPNRMSAIGYGEFKPVADNATEQGREKNRRINIIVLNRKVQDRQRLSELEPRKLMPDNTGQQKLNPIGDSIRQLMGQDLLIPLPPVEIGGNRTNSSGKKQNTTSTPSRQPDGKVDSGSSNSQTPASPDENSQNSKPKLLRLPPPTMLQFGKGSNP